jgi:hypothetical protein
MRGSWRIFGYGTPNFPQPIGSSNMSCLCLQQRRQMSVPPKVWEVVKFHGLWTAKLDRAITQWQRRLSQFYRDQMAFQLMLHVKPLLSNFLISYWLGIAYTCKWCGIHFSVFSNLRQHHKTRHWRGRKLTQSPESLSEKSINSFYEEDTGTNPGLSSVSQSWYWVEYLKPGATNTTSIDTMSVQAFRSEFRSFG